MGGRSLETGKTYHRVARPNTACLIHYGIWRTSVGRRSRKTAGESRLQCRWNTWTKGKRLMNDWKLGSRLSGFRKSLSSVPNNESHGLCKRGHLFLKALTQQEWRHPGLVVIAMKKHIARDMKTGVRQVETLLESQTDMTGNDEDYMYWLLVSGRTSRDRRSSNLVNQKIKYEFDDDSLFQIHIIDNAIFRLWRSYHKHVNSTRSRHGLYAIWTVSSVPSPINSPQIATTATVIHAPVPTPTNSVPQQATAYESDREIAISRIFDLAKVASLQDPESYFWLSTFWNK